MKILLITGSKHSSFYLMQEFYLRKSAKFVRAIGTVLSSTISTATENGFK